MKYRIQYRPYRRKFIRPMRLGTTFSSERRGAIVRLLNESGNAGFGECAPLPGFAVESLEEAINYCHSFGNEITEKQIEGIPEIFPCLRYAIESAQIMADSGLSKTTQRKLLPTATLLPVDKDVIEHLARLTEEGFTTFKWKIGVDDFTSEEKIFHRISTALPSGGRLRLDANGILDKGQTKSWLELLDGCDRIEFLEQPLPAECFEQMRKLADSYSTAIALDESAAGLKSLKNVVGNGWAGPLVIKPSIVGSPTAFLQWSANCSCPLVFSSGFETAIGFQTGLELAMEARNCDFALGFGTNGFFAQDGLSRHGNGPELNPDLLSLDDCLQIWDRLDTPQKKTIPSRSGGKDIFLCEKNPKKFQHFFFNALKDGRNRIFLANPDWGRRKWKEALDLVRPDEICGSAPHELQLSGRQQKTEFNHLSARDRLIMIPTGGSTSGLRFSMHTWETLSNAAESFVSGFGISPVNSFCLLPLHHVSGLMQLIRARQTGGRFVFGSHKELLAGRFPDFDPCEFIISLVTLQLRRLLEFRESAIWLKRFKMVLLGGGKVDKELLDSTRKEGIRLAPSYGLTETAAVCAALTPEKFLSSQKGSGSALPGVDINICDDDGQSLPTGTRGRIHIRSKSLFFGYFPDFSRESGEAFASGDEGFLDSDGSLHVTGRLDRIIITGGEKVDPSEVEQAIMKSGLVADVYVYGVNDQEWGQKVVALYVPLKKETTQDGLKASIIKNLTLFQVPKIWKCLTEIPRNDLGKIDLDRIEREEAEVT